MTDAIEHVDNNMYVDTDVFVVAEDEYTHDFIMIDETPDILSDAIVIDMTGSDMTEMVTIDLEVDPDSFVSLDEDVFVSDFHADDYSSDFIDLHLSDDIVTV